MISFEGTVPSEDEIRAIEAALNISARDDDGNWRQAMRESILSDSCSEDF
jgi:hypothetical protein